MTIHTSRLVSCVMPLGLLIAAALADRPADAAWEFVPNLELQSQTDNNVRLIPDGTPGFDGSGNTTSAVADVTLELATYNERSFLTFEPSITAYRYTGNENSDLEGNDVFFTGGGEYTWRTVAAGFNANYRRERLVDAEFADVDLDNNPDTANPDIGETGRLVFIDQTRTYSTASPYVSFEISPRNTLKIDLTASDVNYSGGNLAFRSGYTTERLTTGIYRNIDKQNQVSAVVHVENYEVDFNQNTFDTVTIEGAFAHPLSTSWNFNLAAGVLRSDYKIFDLQQRPTESATTDFTLRVGLRKRTERARYNIDLTRAIWPSSSGYAVVRHEASLYADRAVTARLTMTFGFRVQETKALSNLSNTDNRTYGVAAMDFEWAIKPVLFLIAGWDYKTQEYDNTLLNFGKMDATSIYLGVRYRGLSKRNPQRR